MARLGYVRQRVATPDDSLYVEGVAARFSTA